MSLPVSRANGSYNGVMTGRLKHRYKGVYKLCVPGCAMSPVARSGGEWAPSKCATSKQHNRSSWYHHCTLHNRPFFRISCRSRGSMEERWTSDPTVAGSSPAAIVLCVGSHGVAVALRIPNPTTAVRFRLRSSLWVVESPLFVESPMV